MNLKLRSFFAPTVIFSLIGFFALYGIVRFCTDFLTIEVVVVLLAVIVLAWGAELWRRNV